MGLQPIELQPNCRTRRSAFVGGQHQADGFEPVGSRAHNWARTIDSSQEVGYVLGVGGKALEVVGGNIGISPIGPVGATISVCEDIGAHPVVAFH